MGANDLYTGLMSPYLRKGQNGRQFWGLYDPLDHVNTPDSTLFLGMQIRNLKTLEGSARYNATNAFLKQAEPLFNDHATTAEEKISNEAYNRILELLNAGLRGSSLNPNRRQNLEGIAKQDQKSYIEQQADILVTELQNLLAQVGANKTISKQAVQIVEARLKNFKWDSKSLHDYIMAKADLVEALMVDKLNQNPALYAIVTGSWIDSSGKQLIEDAFAFNKGELDIPFALGRLKFTIKTADGDKEGTAGSIKEFLTQVEALNGQSFKVQVSDELYDALREGAAIAGQAKSGLHGQAILNRNKRNALSLEDVGFDPMLLWELYQVDQETRTQFFKPTGEQDSKSLEALANYCLSKNIAKTALAANQLYLTAEGFVSASQWLETNNRYLIFQPAVRSVSGDFLTKQRPYYFTD